MKHIFSIIALAFACLPLLKSQGFPCLDQFYITLNENSAPSTLYVVESDGITTEFDFNFSIPFWVNGIGYNPIDRHIYAVHQNTDEILKIDVDGNVEVVGRGTNIGGNWVSVAADCSPTGKFINVNRTDDHLYFFNVVGTFAEEQRVQLVWHPSSGNTGIADIDLDDLVLDPFQSGVIYTYQRASWTGEPARTANHLLRIDANPGSPTFGNVFDVAELTGGQIVQIGAMFFNAKGELFGYGSRTGPPYRQDQLVKINKFTGETTQVGRGPQAAGNDGCSCPYTVAATKEVDQITPLCEDAIIDYNITVHSRAIDVLRDLTFRDILPPQVRVLDVFPPDPFGMPASAGSGVGFNELVYEAITLQPGDSITFQLSILVPLELRTLSNQFVLQSLPSFLGETILSDDPTTVSVQDPTIAILPEPLPQIEVALNAIICNDSSYDFGGMQLTEEGDYEFLQTGATPQDCDTLFQLNLAIEDEVTREELVSICPGEVYTFNDTTLVEAGVYTFTLTGQGGDCDTLFLLNLAIEDQITREETVNLCPGEVYTINGTTLAESGAYTFTLDGQGEGCDTMLIVDVRTVSSSIKDTTICFLEGNTFTFGDLSIISEGTYEYIMPFSNQIGCDSIIRITAEVVSSENPFYLPNAFSPGIPDGVNDRLVVFPGPAAMEIKRFLIFNRWGGLVYELYDQPFRQPLTTWDGRIDSEFVKNDVLTFLIEVEMKDNSLVRQTGSLVLF